MLSDITVNRYFKMKLFICFFQLKIEKQKRQTIKKECI